MSGSMQAKTDTVKARGFATIGAPYIAVGVPFGHSVRMMRLVNLCDAAVMFSDDGVNDKWPVPPGSFVLYDYTANSQSDEGVLVYSSGTQIYVRQLAAVTSGSVYVECTYSRGD